MSNLEAVFGRNAKGKETVSYNISTVNNKAEIISKSWDREVFDGGYSGYTLLKLQGFCNRVVGTKRDLTTLKANKIPLPSGAQNLAVVASSGNRGGARDHYSTGIGVKTVRVEGLNSTWALTGVDVRLAGTNAAAVPGTWRRINDFYIVSAGVLKEPDGHITLQLSGGGKKISKITTANGSGRLGQVSIPSGSTGYILSWGGGAVGAEVLLSLRAMCDHNGTYMKSVFIDHDHILLKDNHQRIKFDHPIKLPGKTTVKLSAQNVRNTSTARVFGHAEIYYAS